MNEFMNGYIPDPRSLEQKQLDYTHVEILGAGIPSVVWHEKTTWKTLSVRKQATSSSCGAQALAKILESFNGPIESATPTYRARKNFSGEGMYVQDIGSVGKKGTTTEYLSPSQNMDEQQMNNAPIPVTLPDKIGGYYILPLEMDTIAAALDKGHGVIFGLGSSAQEWIDVPVVTTYPTTFGHFIACVSPNYLLYKGEKAFVIDDSCNQSTTLNQSGQRILTESFLRARCGAVLGVLPVGSVDPLKPHYSLNKNLSYGMMHDEQVKNLQDMLKYDGSMDASIPSTGNFLSATKQAVVAFQTKYSIANPPTGFCGPLTRAKLQLLFV